MSQPIVFVNGEFVEEGQARVSVFEHGFLYGDGVFDTAVAWNGFVFKLDEHLKRLFRSMAAVALGSPYSYRELRRLVLETVRRNGLQNAYIKIVVTRGTTPEPLIEPRGAETGCVIFARPFLYWVHPEKLKSGIRVKISAIRRTSTQALDPRIKTLNYQNLVLARLEAHAAQVDEALVLDSSGHVCEGPGCNVFCVHGRRLDTPSASVLEGVTRATVMELAGDIGLDVREANVDPYDLYTADEVFLSSSAGGLIPVVEADGRVIGEGRPGPIATDLAERYQQLLESGTHGTPIYEADTTETADIAGATT